MVINVARRLYELYQEGGSSELLSGIYRWQFYRRRRLRQWATVNWLKMRYGTYVKRDIHGSTIELDLEANGIHKFLATYRTRETESLKFYESKLNNMSDENEDILVLDLGSNIGHYALLAAKSCPESKVVAIEPDPRNYECLQRNISLNDYGNINSRHEAVGPEVGEATLNLSTETNLNHISSVDAGSDVIDQINVDMTTVDELVKGHSTSEDCMVVLRMDVEGYEPEILKGAKELLAGDHPLFLFIEAHERFMDKEDFTSMIDLLNDSGLSLSRAHFTNIYEPREYLYDWDDCKSQEGIGHIFANR